MHLIKYSGAFIFSLLLCSPASVFIKQNFALQDQWLLPLSFLLVFIGGFILLGFLAILFKKIISDSLQTSFANKLGGIIPGFMAGIIAVVIINKILASSLWSPVNDQAKNNSLLSSFDLSSAFVGTNLNKIFNDPVEQKISGAFEASAGLNKSDEFKCAEFYSRPDLEKQLLDLVNQERIQHGIKPVTADSELQKIAQAHATDMFNRGYFSHNTPEGTDPFERMRKASIDFLAAGENLAHSSNMLSAHRGLMRSPGHRANILNPSFGRLGISILDGASKGLMLVEEFRD